MKHQITFVGGQLLPVYVGIKEFNPDEIHFIVTKETIDNIKFIKTLISGKYYSENICNPFDFDSIRKTCEDIFNKIALSDEVLVNLTGGTKIMVLAAQLFISEKQVKGFYLNQNDSVLLLPSYKIQKLSYEISIKEFLKIGGHVLSSYKTLDDFALDDYNSAETIEMFSTTNNKLYLQINSKVRNSYDKQYNIPPDGNLQINANAKLIWTRDCISVELNGIEIFKIKSPNVRSLFFHAAWWELVVAKAISNWSKAKELLIQCELPFKNDTKTTKNEIDILINLGRKLVFIECKSGFVKQEDINKMRIVKDTYGGIISRSLLVCRYMPKPTIFEKCRELNIDIFCCYDGRRKLTSLNDLVDTLNNIERKLTI